MNKYIIEKLREGRANAKLKQSEVAKKIGIKGNTLSNYENGVSEPDIDTFCALCDIYNIDPSNILNEAYGLGVQGQEFKIKPSEIEHLKKYRFISEHSPENAEIIDAVLNKGYSIAEQISEQKKRIEELEATAQKSSEKLQPLRIYTYFGRIACAGSGFYFDEIPTETIAAPDKGGDFIIGVNGDSMEPDYYDGDLLYVKKTDYISHGDVGIFTIGNECFLKECGENGLISRNKDYSDIPGTEDVRLIGKVIGKVGE